MKMSYREFFYLTTNSPTDFVSIFFYLPARTLRMGRKHNHFVDESLRKPVNHNRAPEDALTIVLVHPRIPQNTGSIARMCAATQTRLHLVRPFFTITDAKLKRAGLDYWPLVDVEHFESLESWFGTQVPSRFSENNLWFVEVGGEKKYSDAKFAPKSVLFFGDEQDGLPPSLLEKYPMQFLQIPQVNVRSLNLATSAGIVLFEALRQQNFPYFR